MAANLLSPYFSKEPLLVGTLHSPACLNLLAKKTADPLFSKIDFLEVRLDSLPLELLPTLWPLPVIATARHPGEGGSGNFSITKRRHLLEEALPWAAAIDVELRSAKQLASTIARARAMGRLVIFSYHDFKNTPSLTRLDKLTTQAQEMGADIFKIAVTLKNFEEMQQLLFFQKTNHYKIPIACMGMGAFGKESRLRLAQCGAALSYGWLYHPQVVGQCSVEELVNRDY